MVMALGVATTALANGAEKQFAAPENNNAIIVNGNVLSGAKAVVHNGTKMIPLRAICEELGFEVTWNNDSRKIELKNIPAYITLTPDADGYTFAKTAPMQLGKAPVIIEDRTYVPINFIDEILQGTYTEDNGVSIVWGESEEDNVILGEITEIIKDGDKVVQLVLGNNEKILNIDENIAVEDENGGKFEGEFATGMTVKAVSDGIATRSIPPQYPTKKIIVCAVAEKETAAKSVVYVKEITEEGLLVEDFYTGEMRVAISDETVITDAEGNVIKKDDIDISKELEIELSDAMTMSLPPLANATKITVTGEDAKAVISGKIVEVGTENGNVTQLVLGDGDEIDAILNLGEDVAVTDTEGNVFDDEFKIGMNVRALTKGMATMSIPAQYPVSAVIIAE